jgi:hypothetical protein
MAPVLRQWQVRMIPNVIFVGKVSEIMTVLRNMNIDMMERNIPHTIIVHVLQTIILVLEESNLTVKSAVKDIVIEVIYWCITVFIQERKSQNVTSVV